MGILTETVDTVESHPWWVVGGAAVIVLAWYLAASSGGQAKPRDFTFSYGPSDANIAAGTQLAIQQANDQTALSIATLKQQSSDTQFGDYLTYLTTHDANTLQAQLDSINSQANVANNQIAAQGQAYSDQHAVQSQQVAFSGGGGATTNTGAAENYVYALYQQYLGRVPESTQVVKDWASYITSGAQSPSQLLLDIKSSPEGIHYANTGDVWGTDYTAGSTPGGATLA